jgi:HK97 family phage portal protein
MGFLDFIRREKRDMRTSDPALAEFFAGRGLGSTVTAEAVLSNLSTAAACVRLLSELLASSSLHVFRRGADGARSRADDLPLSDILASVTNAGQSAYEFRETAVRDLLLTGNAYARIERGTDGQVVALFRIDPLQVAPERLDSGRMRYRMGGAILLQEDVLHIRGPSRDGITGLSPLAISRGMFGLALTQTETAAKVAEQAVRASGVLTYPGRLSPVSRQEIKGGLDTYAASRGNAGSVMVLDGGAEFKPFGLSAADMEFLASRRLTNEDVCRVFGVPPTCAGITDKATYSNTEQEARALVQNALGPLAARVEAAMNRCLLSAEERRGLYIEHDLAALLRGDVQARFEAYRIGRVSGVFSVNDIRRRENESPIAGGNDHHMPVNWARLGDTPQPQDGAR